MDIIPNTTAQSPGEMLLMNPPLERQAYTRYTVNADTGVYVDGLQGPYPAGIYEIYSVAHGPVTTHGQALTISGEATVSLTAGIAAYDPSVLGSDITGAAGGIGTATVDADAAEAYNPPAESIVDMQIRIATEQAVRIASGDESQGAGHTFNTRLEKH